MSYRIALCGLSARDQRLLETVINRGSWSKFKFQAAPAANSSNPQIAILDASSPSSAALHDELVQQGARLVTVTISDHGMAGASRYRIERKSLFVRILKVLEELVETEFESGKVATHSALRASTRAAPAPEPSPMAPSESAFVEGIGGQPQKLCALVVDDSLTVREQLRGALERLGIACEMAADAEIAMGLLGKARYDLAFLDVVMPGTNGYELCRKIKQNPYTRELHVLMLTSRSSPFDRARGALSGCNSYLTKPITWDVFKQSVDKALAKQFHNDRTLMAVRGYRG
jgi:twitching motility two-component system response regulator PilG